jgi:integrase
MANLTMDSFVFKDNMMFLKINSDIEARNREIPLPKEKLMRYYNKYIKLKEPDTKTFFYGKNKQKIESSFLTDIVKKYLDFCKVDARDKTPKMLRKTYALILNNQKGKDGFTQPEQNIKYLLGLANTSQLREILKYGTIDVVTASTVFENLEI